MKTSSIRLRLKAALFLLTLGMFPAHAAVDKPVKVFILAGQSNRGDIGQVSDSGHSIMLVDGVEVHRWELLKQ